MAAEEHGARRITRGDRRKPNLVARNVLLDGPSAIRISQKKPKKARRLLAPLLSLTLAAEWPWQECTATGPPRLEFWL